MAKVTNTDHAKLERLESAIAGKTPAQAAAWVETNVNDMATAKAALKIAFALLVALNNEATA